jgi:hypothetical protein
VGDLTIRLKDASRRPLDDIVDVALLLRDGRVFGERRGHKGTAAFLMTGLDLLTTYVIRVYPLRHRPVQQFVSLAGREKGTVELFCPIHPDRAKPAFPAYEAIHPKARAILEQSEVESYPGARGRDLYAALPDIPKAGLLNVVAKTAATNLDHDVVVLDQIETFHRIRGDRVFANVTPGLRDMVIAADRFRPVSSLLHPPDTDFTLVDSYKSLDGHGNLHLTFFRSIAMPMRYRADIDIDDAAGIQHAFDVLEHHLTNGRTHPYDIHQILTFRQRLDPGYTLTA